MDAVVAKSSRVRRSRPENAEDETIVHGIPYSHSVSAEDAQNGFARLLDRAQENPTAITRQGKPVAVVLSVKEYESLQRLDDAYWIARTEKALAEEERLSAEESETFTQELLNAKD